MINSLDKGFFLFSRTLPVTPFFHRLNMSYDQLPKMYKAFNQDIKSRKTDFIIIRVKQKLSENKNTLHSQVNSVVDPHLREALNKNYYIQATAENSATESYALLYKK